jgi:hypothetical protein
VTPPAKGHCLLYPLGLKDWDVHGDTWILIQDKVDAHRHAAEELS